MAYKEWLSQSVTPPVWEGTKHPPSSLVDADRYIWYIASTTAITPINTALTLGYSKDATVAPTDPDGVWSYSDQTILQAATSYNTHSHGATNLKIGVADLKFVPTDTTLHPIIWRFGTTSTSAGNAVAFSGQQAANGVVGDVLAYQWTDGVAPFTLKFSTLDGTVLSTQTTSNRSYTMNSTNFPAGNVYVDLYDSNGTFATTKTVLVSPSGSISVTDGEDISVQGVMQIESEESVENGSQMELDGGLPVTAYGDAETSSGADVQVYTAHSLELSVGSTVELSGRIGATGFNLKSDEVKPRYIKQSDANHYSMYLLMSQHETEMVLSNRSGEPSVPFNSVTPVFGTTATATKTTDNSFTLSAKSLGTSQVQINGDEEEGLTYLTIYVVDEYPDTVLVKNGFDVDLADHWITIERKVLLNNNANTVQVDGLVVWSGDVEVSNKDTVIASKDYHIFLSGGSNTNVSGYKAMTHYQKIDNGTNVNVSGSVVWSDDITVTDGQDISLVNGNKIPTSGGASANVYGWKEEPQHSIVVNGARTLLATPQIQINQPTLSVSGGGNVHVDGQRPADISIGYRFTTSVFRGIQMEEDDVVIENPATITLTGVAVGGTMPDVATPCLVFHQSMVAGREFVKGQIEEISEISLDSSIKLGVKLYSCDNTLLNPTTFASAYFTFEDELLILANLDPVKSLITTLATPVDLAILMRGKVYTMNLHVVDKQGNPSIVLTRKLRFI